MSREPILCIYKGGRKLCPTPLGGENYVQLLWMGKYTGFALESCLLSICKNFVSAPYLSSWMYFQAGRITAILTLLHSERPKDKSEYNFGLSECNRVKTILGQLQELF